MIRASIKRPIAISMIYMTIAAMGVLAFRNIPIELLPDTSLPQLTVTAQWPGSSPEVVEAFLTAPLEGAIQQIRGAEKISSVSNQGNASVTVTFARFTDMDFARLELSERMASLEGSLPIGSSAPLVQMYVPEEFQEQQRPVLDYTVTGPYTLEYMRDYLADHVKPDLLQIDGVALVDLQGGRDRVMELELDEQKINALGLRLEQVSTAIGELEIIRQAGTVAAPGGLRYSLSIRQRPQSFDEVRSLPLLTNRGRVVRLADVATVHDTYEEAQSYYRIDGYPAVGMTIRKEPRTNTVAMADTVKAHMTRWEPNLPNGMRVILDDDQSVDIRAQLSDLGSRSLISAVIGLAVLLLFLQSISAAVIVFSTFVFSVLITVNFLYLGGMTLNLLTLMGLAMGFGIVVDNAIVVLENIYRRRRRGEPAVLAAERGTREVVVAILAGTATTIVVLIPFVYLQGELRVFYVPLAVVVGLSQIASLFVGFTFIPSLGAKLLGHVEVRAEQAAVDEHDYDDETAHLPPLGATPWYVHIYGGLIRGTLARPWTTVVIVLLMFGGSYWLFNKHVTRGRIWGGGGSGEQRSYVNIQIRLPRGEELERTDELVQFFEKRLREMPEVERFTSRVRKTNADMRVSFPLRYENTDVPLAIKEELYQYSLGYGGVEVRVTGIGPSFYGGGGSPPNYNIKVLGYNYEKVRDIAEDMAGRLTRYSRIRDVDTNTAGSYFTRDKATELVLDVNREALAMHDLTVANVISQISAAMRGRTSMQTVKISGEELNLSIKLNGFRSMDLHRLNELAIPAPSGQAVRLADVASLRERDVLNTVIRENQQYQRVVSYEFRGPQKLGDKNRDEVIKATLLPPGYTIEERQSYMWDTEQRAQIWGVLLLAIILVYMVTAATFESLKQPLCVLLTVPMALIGVFLMFFYMNASFTREAYVGVIMMSGIVVNNSILLIDHINQLRRRYGLPLLEAVERGTIERVRPILMTTMTTICSLLPLVLFSTSADQNIWNALTYALIGGLSSSTLLVLTVAPALYLLFERRAERRKLAVSEVELGGVPA